MYNICIISSSVRIDRMSHRAAMYFQNRLEAHPEFESEILDLKIYNFPIFEERLRFLKNPDQKILDFAAKIKNSDAVLIVTPEYNGSMPASLKNCIDLLYGEWKRKPVGIITCSSGSFGGAQVLGDLQFVLWKIGAHTIPAIFPIPKIQDVFDENGKANDPDAMTKRVEPIIDELMYWLQSRPARTTDG